LLLGLFAADSALLAGRAGQTLIADRHYYGGTPPGVLVRVLQRILALTAAIWHSDRTGQPVTRSLAGFG
jgi:hypothetical protein